LTLNIKKTSPPDLLNNDITITLRKMTLPTIVGMVVLMTFGLVDTFFIGMLGTQELAAISFTFPVTFTVISLNIGLGITWSKATQPSKGDGNRCVNVDYGVSDCFCCFWRCNFGTNLSADGRR
jgi:Na+-driven multidrug efflux pump